MTSRVIEGEYDREMLVKLIREQKPPFTVDIVSGRRRSVEQNHLQRLWLKEIAEQFGDRTTEEVRGYCKLTIGVPILREENTRFRERYDAIVKPLSYEQKMQIMMEPLDMPVTRLMTTKQKTAYLEGVFQHFSEKGIILTIPKRQAPEARAA